MKWNLLILALLTVGHLYRIVLNVIQYRSANNPTPANVADVYDAETYGRWKKYNGEKCRLSIFSVAVSYVLMLILLCTGAHAAFASLFPDTRVLLYGLIPLKIKWLAIVDACFFAYDIFFYFSAGYPLYALMPVVAILNFFLFFGGNLFGAAKYKKESFQHRHSKQTVDFKKAQQEIKQRKGYLHKCSVCGATDTDHPELEFRYCSKCSGYHCYCMDHIQQHVHIQ